MKMKKMITVRLIIKIIETRERFLISVYNTVNLCQLKLLLVRNVSC